MNKSFFLNAPLTINITLSYRCNFNCIHCYSREEDFKNELTFKQLKTVIDILASWKVPFLNIGGGEPLIYPHLFEFVSYATSKGIQCSMNTNGYLLDREVAKKIKQTGFKSIGVSIDSPEEEKHDLFRNKKGSFKKALAALENLYLENVKTTVSMVISKLNFNNFQDLIPILRQYKVAQLFLHNYKCSGLGYKNMEQYDLTPEEWKDFYSRALQLKKITKDIIISFDDPILHLLPEYEDTPLVKGSTCGKLSLNIKSNGDITPCGFMPVILGNIIKDDITKIWKDSPILNILRNPIPQGKCISCGVFENCLGGCKARTYMLTGEFHKPDPHCWKKGGDIE